MGLNWHADCSWRHLRNFTQALTSRTSQTSSSKRSRKRSASSSSSSSWSLPSPPPQVPPLPSGRVYMHTCPACDASYPAVEELQHHSQSDHEACRIAVQYGFE